jgi:hypothetical protein
MSGLSGLLIALALAASVQDGAVQTPSEVQAPEVAVPVDDVLVSGGKLRDRVQSFVDEVAAPTPRRGLARWRDPLCIATANVDRAVAQPIIDHVARVGASYGLKVREPGCNPNVVIIFTDEAPNLAKALVTAEPEAFRVRWTRQLDRGSIALSRFQEMEAPVRWWHVSIPVLGWSGKAAISLPGLGAPLVQGEGRVNRGRPVSDQFNKVIIIVDVNRVEGVMLPQLADYLALVTLAQIDPESDMQRYDTVLNVFNNPGAVAGLSEWDRAYLAALYEAHPERIDRADQATGVTSRLRREERRLAAAASD